MANKRKYPKVEGYWVYSIKIPSVNKYYIGISKRQCRKRWQKANYKSGSLAPYLSEWDSMVKTVLVDNLSKEQAYQYEGKIIEALNMNNLCLNSNRSGMISVNDKNAYQREREKQRYENDAEYREHEKQRHKQWKEDNPEYMKQYNKQYYENNKEKVKQWHLDNKEKLKQYQKEYYKRKKLEKQLQNPLPLT